jgi:uncharacterized OB-fold protein
MNQLTAYKCKKCGHVMYPLHARCLKCNAREFDPAPLGGKCQLITFTQLTELPWGIDERTRYLGIVEFGNGVRALGKLETTEPKIGMELVPGWGTVRVIGGEKICGLILKPA